MSAPICQPIYWYPSIRLFRSEEEAIHTTTTDAATITARSTPAPHPTDRSKPCFKCARVCVPMCVRRRVRARMSARAFARLRAYRSYVRARTCACVRRAAALKAADGDLIATGHTLSDRAETVLYRLAASGTARGLTALPPRDGQWVRPLLDCSRDEVRDELRRRGVASRTCRRDARARRC